MPLCVVSHHYPCCIFSRTCACCVLATEWIPRERAVRGGVVPHDGGVLLRVPQAWRHRSTEAAAVHHEPQQVQARHTFDSDTVSIITSNPLRSGKTTIQLCYRIKEWGVIHANVRGKEKIPTQDLRRDMRSASPQVAVHLKKHRRQKWSASWRYIDSVIHTLALGIVSRAGVTDSVLECSV